MKGWFIDLYEWQLEIWGAIHERWSHVRYDFVRRTTDVVATIRPIHESSRKK